MECVTAREAISATLDGERPGVSAVDLDAHLAMCGPCFRWRERAAELSRRSRLTRMEPVPDVADVVLARISLPLRRSDRLPWLRILLAAIAVVQIGIGMAQFVTPMFGHGAHQGVEPMFGHVGRETAAFNIAIGAGMLWVALYPRRAVDQLPLLGTLVVLLGLVSAYDLGSGNVGWTRLVTHLPVLLATVVVVALHRRRPRPVDPEASRVEAYDPLPAGPDEEPSRRVRAERSSQDPEPPAAARRYVA